MAKTKPSAKTTRKKKPTKAAGKSASKSSRKSTPKKVAKPTSRPKTKASAKKTAAKPSVTSKKQTTSKKTASASKSAPRKKPTSKKSPPKTSAKKTPPAAKSAPEKKSKAKALTIKTPSAAKPKKTKKPAVTSKRGKSVAEVASTTAADEKGYVFINGRRVRMISTQGLTLPKKSRAAASTTDGSDADKGPTKPLKTRLTAKQLRYYRDLLLRKRSELIGDLSAMEAAALRSSGGNLSHMPIHMADIGTDTYDQDFMLGLAETERKQLREIEDALRRIDDKTYGVCHMTGKDIPRARLDAKPWAKYTIEAARLVENQMNS